MSAESEVMNGYKMRQESSSSSDLATLYACLAQEDADWQCHRSVWDRVLGLGTMALISACGWTVIIAVVRLLR
jgi:hypothetical protein